MARHRTTARGILLTLLTLALTVAAGSASAHPPPAPPATAPASAKAVTPKAPRAPKAPKIVFPVLGPTTLTDSFGAARGDRSHEGEDIMAPRRAPAVAVEAGTVRFWTTSSRAGCMLYLHGDSGATYLYIHLNNDLGRGNDNRGRCVQGVAYATGLENGDRVAAGELVGYVGDSGDADGIAPHLHFEYHPKGGAARDPYPLLRRATRLLFAAKHGTTFTLALTGTVVAAGEADLQLKVAQVRSWPGGRRIAQNARKVRVAVPATAQITGAVTPALVAPALSALLAGTRVTVWTSPAKASLPALRAAPGVLSARRVDVKA